LAVGEVKSDIDSKEKLEDALNKIKSVKELDRSNQGRNLIVTGPGMSFSNLKFDPLTKHLDQITGFIFTSTSMTTASILEVLKKHNSKIDRRLWANLFCAYKKFIISYVGDDELTPSAMDAKKLYCTTDDEIPNLLLLFVSILATFINAAHIARPNYFSYANMETTRNAKYPLE
jgi:hypothetical protein